MGLFQSFSKWQSGRKQRRISEMQAKNKCPDCGGKGFYMFSNEYFMTTPYDCPGCNGSGTFSDWVK